MNDWRIYERFVSSLQSNEASDEITVVPNVRLIGTISGRKRQVDVLIDARFGDSFTRRVIVDAKRHRRKIDITHVEAFEGMMRDCRAQHGVLVCPNGYTSAALRRAQEAITIKLVPLEELKGFNLREWDTCLGSCAEPKTKRKASGLVMFDSPFGFAVGDSPLSITAVGKCDVCSNFHIWCWDCGKKFALGNEDEGGCNCDRFWLTAIEQEEDGCGGTVEAVHLFMVMHMGVVIPVDRRRLS